jgi:hypothetical protein
MTGELVQQDGDSIDTPTALEVCLYFLWRCTIIDVTHKYASRIHIFFILAQLMALLVERGLHLAKLCGFGFHFFYAFLHSRNIFLLIAVLVVNIKLLLLLVNLHIRVCHGGDVDKVVRIEDWDERVGRLCGCENRKRVHRLRGCGEGHVKALWYQTVMARRGAGGESCRSVGD